MLQIKVRYVPADRSFTASFLSWERGSIWARHYRLGGAVSALLGKLRQSQLFSDDSIDRMSAHVFEQISSPWVEGDLRNSAHKPVYLAMLPHSGAR